MLYSLPKNSERIFGLSPYGPSEGCFRNTLICTQLISSNEDDFICKAATTVEEAKQLIETGFEYVCEVDGAKLFRKRK